MWIIDKDLISNGRDKGRCSVNLLRHSGFAAIGSLCSTTMGNVTTRAEQVTTVRSRRWMILESRTRDVLRFGSMGSNSKEGGCDGEGKAVSVYA